jgi:hypothetical protein
MTMLTALDVLRKHLVKASVARGDYFTLDFLRWFGRSTVVDKRGFPLPAYRAEHGSYAGQSKGGLVHYAASLDAAQFHTGCLQTDHQGDHVLASLSDLLNFAQKIAGLRINQTGRGFGDKRDATLDANSIAFVYLKMLRPLDLNSVSAFYVNGSNVTLSPDPKVKYQREFYKGGEVPKKPYAILRETIGGSIEFAELLKNSGYDGVIFKNANSFGKLVYGILPGNNTYPIYKAHKPGVKFKITPKAIEYHEVEPDDYPEEDEEGDDEVSARVAAETKTYPFKFVHEYGLNPRGVDLRTAKQLIKSRRQRFALGQRVVGFWFNEDKLVVDSLIERVFYSDEDVLHFYNVFYMVKKDETVDEMIRTLKEQSDKNLAKAAKGVYWQPYDQEARKLTYIKVK